MVFEDPMPDTEQGSKVTRTSIGGDQTEEQRVREEQPNGGCVVLDSLQRASVTLRVSNFGSQLAM